MKKLKRIRILYAEDNEDAGFMLSTLLGFSDIDVSLACSVKKAFEDAQTEYFDAYLLESRFSEGCGLELCRRLHEFSPQTPIVFYSGDANQTDKQKGLAAGANVYLVKPEINTVIPTILRLTSVLSGNIEQ